MLVSCTADIIVISSNVICSCLNNFSFGVNLTHSLHNKKRGICILGIKSPIKILLAKRLILAYPHSTPRTCYYCSFQYCECVCREEMEHNTVEYIRPMFMNFFLFRY